MAMHTKPKKFTKTNEGAAVLMKTIVMGMFPEKLAEFTRLLSTGVWKIKSHHFMSKLSGSFINSDRKK